MEEDIEILEKITKYKDDIGIPILGPLEYEAIEHLIQVYKEDKAVMHCVIEDIRTRSIDCVYSHEELEQRYRNKVKEEKR